jgi:hypothetical protein
LGLTSQFLKVLLFYITRETSFGPKLQDRDQKTRMAPPESPKEHPAMTPAPRYLTGKKEEIKEFLDKFDVSLISERAPMAFTLYFLILAKKLIVSIRYFYSIAMVRAAPLRSLVFRPMGMTILRTLYPIPC